MNAPPPAQALDAREIPALLGIARNGLTRWTLWQRAKGNLPAQHEHPIGVPHIGHALHEHVVAWLLDNGLLNAPARRPTGAAHHRTLPLYGAPDLVIDEAPHHGAGCGFALTALLDPREWRGRWQGNRTHASVPAELRTTAQALFLLCPAQWAIVVPVVGINTMPYPPITLEPDPELGAQIEREITAFYASLAANRPPDPDALADTPALEALAALCPPANAPPRDLEAEEAERMTEQVNATLASQQVLEDARTRYLEARREHKDNVARLVAHAEQGGAWQSETHRLRLDVRPSAPVPARSNVFVHIEARDGQSPEHELALRPHSE